VPAGGVLLTRVSTRSAVSRSVNWVATVARSASRRASRSLTFAFSALIWSNIVGVVVGMVAFSCFSSIGMINFAAKQRWRATALVFAPDRGSQVRIRLTAGERWIRTLGPP